ncbi:MAG: Spy/CpxP family protein refolding chaperone [Thermoanaerobaculia bacterium]
MQTRFPVVTLFSAVILMSGVAAAQMPEVPPGKWWKRPAVVQSLALSAEQQDKLDQILQKNRREFVDLKADVEKKQLDVEDLMAKKDSDPKKVASAVDLLEGSRAKLRKAMSMMVLEMRGVLNDTQWKQLLERREQWRLERREHMREQLREGRPPRRPADGNAPNPPAPQTLPDPKE